MLRTCFLIFLLLCTLSAFSQTHIFYVDLSSRDSRLRHTSEHIMRNIQNLDNKENLLFFISNGGRPIIANNKEEVPIILNELIYAPPPIRPSFFNDIDTINVILSQKELIIGVNEESRSIGHPLNIYFYLSPIDSQLDDLVGRFLLTNRLFKQKGLLSNVRVNIYFDCPADEGNCQQTLENYQNKYKDYEIYLF